MVELGRKWWNYVYGGAAGRVWWSLVESGGAVCMVELQVGCGSHRAVAKCLSPIEISFFFHTMVKHSANVFAFSAALFCPASAPSTIHMVRVILTASILVIRFIAVFSADHQFSSTEAVQRLQPLPQSLTKLMLRGKTCWGKQTITFIGNLSLFIIGDL